MKAYEFPTKITPEGTLELPDELLESLPNDQVVKVIVLVNEPVDEEDFTEDCLGFSPESFHKSLHQAMTGQTLPLSQLLRCTHKSSSLTFEVEKPPKSPNSGGLQ